MAEQSKIEWTDATWNPVTGCTLVSEGCRNCYAAELAAGRLRDHPSRKGLARRNADGTAKFTGEVRLNADWLEQPLRWRKPRMIFVCAHGDLFHESVPMEWIDRVCAVMALCPQHVFQVLTKRPERMRDYFASQRQHILVDEIYKITGDDALAVRGWDWWDSARSNVWLGVSVEDQETADARIPLLLQTPAAVRWLSAEPLLGPLDLRMMDYEEGDIKPLSPWTWGEIWEGGWKGTTETPEEDEESFLDWYQLSQMPDFLEKPMPGLDWVVVGGESGKNARPMRPDWARKVRDQCAAAGVPFLFKQWGEWAPRLCHEKCKDVAFSKIGKEAAGRLLDGVTHDGFPGQRGVV